MKKLGCYVKKILKILWILLLLLVILSILAVAGLRLANEINHHNKYKDGVNETAYIDINGQKQYVMMMGCDKTNPVIIYLHGGPSSPDTCISYAFSDYLTDEYTFIAWDQRGCGRTYYENYEEDPENETASFEQALEDVDALVDYACEKFGQDKVIIMGHSYGSVLGSTYVRNHPEKVSAYIGVGQMVSLEKADLYSYNDALQKAKEVGDDTAELEDAYQIYCDDPGIPTLLPLRNLTSKYHPVEKEGETISLALFSPYAGVNDIKWFLKQMGDISEYVSLNQQLFDYVMSVNLEEESKDYEMPVFFISGAEDWICPVDTTQTYYEEINAPYKDFHTIEGCGHSVQVADPENFASEVKVFLSKN